jgi:hypothetical protein
MFETRPLPPEHPLAKLASPRAFVLSEHPLLAQEAERSFKLAEAARSLRGPLSEPCWPDSPEPEFVVWGEIAGKTVLVQRPGNLVLKKEKT